MALNTTATLTQEFVDALAMEMLPKPDDTYQFFSSPGLIHEPFSPGSKAGTKQILMNQPAFPGAGFAEADRRTTEATRYAGGTPLSITETQYPLVLREYGGPHDGVGPVPIGLSEFLIKSATSDLVSDVGGKLRRDYLRWRDAVIRDLALGTTSLVTADGTAEGAITAAKKASYEWLTRVRKTLKQKLVPAGANGRYIGFLDPKDVTDLLNDADVKQAKATRDDAPVITGYIGTVAGFDLYEATTFPTKAVGAGGAVTGYQSFFHGTIPGIGHYTHQAATPRVDKNDDFGRMFLTMWFSEEAYGECDLDNAVVRGITT